MDNIILTTTPNLDGYKILEYIDVISEEVCFANKLSTAIDNTIEDIVSIFNSFFKDTEMKGTSTAILKAKEYVKEKIKLKAKELGANAIIGIDYETTYVDTSSLIRVSINGTAVIVKSFEDIKKETEEKK